MKHTSKRLQALVLVLAMCVSFLQIPSFATDNGHHGEVIARRATFASDGSFTVTKSCDAHPNASEETVSGKIIEKKVATGTSYVAVDKDGKELVNVDASKTKNTEVGCNNDGSITYYINVNGKTFYSDKFVTAKATGEHRYKDVPKDADYDTLTADDFADKDYFELVNSTATCDVAGEATFKKKCTSCGQFIDTALVTVKRGALKDHEFIKETVDGKLQEKVFEEVVQAPTCTVPGWKYEYKQCKCGVKKYNKGNNDFTADTKGSATLQMIDTIVHPYEYTVKQTTGTAYVKGNDLTATNFTATATCPACNKTITVSTKEAKLVADKTIVPEFACVPGSQTYVVTYTIPTTVSGEAKDKDVTVEVTVPYYLTSKGKVDHDSPEVYVPDEESYVKATCTKDGHYNMVKVCKVCGDKEVVATVKIPATGKHTAAAAKKENVVAATTKKGGSYDLVVRCADCGEIISSTHKTTAKIVVNASKINSVKNYKGKKAKVTVKKATSVIGYQIQYGTKKNFKGAKHVNTRKTSKYLTKLAKNKKYYIRVRTYKTVDGKLYFSSWSGAKTVTIKK